MSFLRAAPPVDTLHSVGIDIGKSFEEIRYEDYLKSFKETGRLPPPPVPQEPTSVALRKAQGLPPLFQPYVPPNADAPGASSSSTSAATTLGGTLSAPAIVDPKDLPAAQSFKTTTMDRETSTIIHGPTLLKTDSYFSISAMPEYLKFSFEELRCKAYSRGNKEPPASGVLMHSFEQGPVVSSSTTSAGLNTSVVASGDNMQVLSAKEGYQQHCLEEHRIAWIKLGRPSRDITSAELLGNAPIEPNPSATSTSNILGAGTTTTTTTPASTFGSAAGLTSRPLAPAQSAPSLFSNPNPVRPW